MKLIIFLCIISSCWAGFFQKKVIKFLDIDNCQDYDLSLAKIILENVSLTADSTRKSLFSCTYRVLEDIDKMEAEIGIVQCANNDSPDSCLTFKSMKIPDLCKLYSASNSAWSSIISNAEPKWGCPTKKGSYRIKDAYLDIEKMPFPFDSNYRWRTKIKCIDPKTKNVACCTTFTMQIIPKKE